MAAHRYWRLRCLISGTGTNEVETYDIEMRATAGGADQCNASYAISSGEYSISYLEEYAFDGDISATLWVSPNQPVGEYAWVGQDFGSDTDVLEVTFKCGTSTYYTDEIIVEWSDNGIDWTATDTYSNLSWTPYSTKTFAVTQEAGDEIITWVGGTSYSEAVGGGSGTLTLPAHQADDFAVIFCKTDSAPNVPTLALTVASGWTTLVDQVEHTGGRDRVNYIFYKKLTSGSETSPVITTDDAEEHSGTLGIWRGVDTTTPFDATFEVGDASNNALPTNDAITTVTDNAAIVLFHGATHDDITVAGAPSGYSMGPYVLSDGNNHRGNYMAYLLDAGAYGTKTPGAWTHTASPTDTAEYSVYTLALRPASTNTVYEGGSSGLRSAARAGNAAGTFNGAFAGSAAGLRSETRVGSASGTLSATFTGSASGVRSASRLGVVAGTLTGSFTGSAGGIRSAAGVGSVSGEFDGTFAGSASGVRSAARTGTAAGTLIQPSEIFTGASNGLRAAPRIGVVSGVFNGTSVGSASGIRSIPRVGESTGAFIGTFTGSAAGLRVAPRMGDSTGVLNGSFSGSASGIRSVTRTGSATGSLVQDAQTFTGTSSGLRSASRVGTVAGTFEGVFAGSADGLRSATRLGGAIGTFEGSLAGSAQGVRAASRIGSADGAFLQEAQTFTGASTGLRSAALVGAAAGVFEGSFTGSSTGLRAASRAGATSGVLLGLFLGSGNGLRSSPGVGGVAGSFTGLMVGAADGVRSQARVGSADGVLIVLAVPDGTMFEIPLEWQEPVVAVEWSDFERAFEWRDVEMVAVWSDFEAPMLWAEPELIAIWKEAA